MYHLEAQQERDQFESVSQEKENEAFEIFTENELENLSYEFYEEEKDSLKQFYDDNKFNEYVRSAYQDWLKNSISIS